MLVSTLMKRDFGYESFQFSRNAGVEDRYSVLIRLENQFSANGFYYSFNGKKFKPSEVEVCHMYFVQSVQYTMSAEIATTPPEFAELPTCPVCLERLDYNTSGITSTLCDHSFQCSCVSKYTHLSCLVCRLCQQQDEKPSCAVCGILNNLWVCLICGFVGCGRYEKGHAIGHWSDKQHRFSLGVEKQQIWDYVGERYAHRLNQSKVGGKSVMINSHCNSVGECGTCVCDGGAELDGAFFSSKVEAIVDEYNHLLASQLEIQRKHYESLLTEAKSRRESSVAKAFGKAIFSRTHDLQDKLESYEEEKKAVADRNQELMKEQELLQKMFKAIEERERETLNSREENVIDLQEQINKSDYKIFKREGCKHYYILGEIFCGTTAIGGLDNASTQLPATSEEERQLQNDFLNRGVHVHVEKDDVDEVSNTCRREEIGTSGEHRRNEPKISKSDKLEACMAQCSSTVSLKNEETELRTLNLKAKLSKIQGKSCNQSDSEADNPDPYSTIVCLDILNNMKGVSNEVYMKAIKAFKDPDFRVSFVKMPKARKVPILELL
ncbi:BRCA1-associated protein [Forsythia ovata]|uniref:BRCA1-associated protein n=1 Tax=Forsythia ovata TaxID=205694 RepID=A0ABD1SKB0_9LAMI